MSPFENSDCSFRPSVSCSRKKIAKVSLFPLRNSLNCLISSTMCPHRLNAFFHKCLFPTSRSGFDVVQKSKSLLNVLVALISLIQFRLIYLLFTFSVHLCVHIIQLGHCWRHVFRSMTQTCQNHPVSPTILQ